MADALRVNGKNFTVTKMDDLTVQVVTPEVLRAVPGEFRRRRDDHAETYPGKNCRRQDVPLGLRRELDPKDIVCSGPFRLKDYKPAQYVLLERNPYFFEVDSNSQRLPYFDNIMLTVVPDMNAMSLRFLSGESDADDFINPYEYDHFKAESAKGKFNLLEPGIGLETAFFWFNENTNVNAKTGQPLVNPQKLKWFRNAKFRQAILVCDRPRRHHQIGLFRPRHPELRLRHARQQEMAWTRTPGQYPHDPDKALGVAEGNRD